MTATAELSVVIPAHDEEAVLGRCLDALLRGARPGELEIVVAANGCTDGTAALARSYGPPVRVVEVARAAKHAALNAADAVATVFPRAYLDADIELDLPALRAVARAMREAGALVGAPQPRVDVAGCAPAVRAYYRVWCELPWFTDNPVGGVYVLSAEGHRRLGGFPDLLNDDQYVHDSFASAERVCVRGHEYVIRAPRTAATLVRCRARTIAGQRQLRAAYGEGVGGTARPSVPALLARRPRLALDLPVFWALTRAAARLADRRAAAGETGWARDETNRAPVAEGVAAR